MMELNESNNPKDADMAEKIKSILTPPSPNCEEETISITSKDVSMIMFILIVTVLVISGLHFMLNA